MLVLFGLHPGFVGSAVILQPKFLVHLLALGGGLRFGCDFSEQHFDVVGELGALIVAVFLHLLQK